MNKMHTIFLVVVVWCLVHTATTQRPPRSRSSVGKSPVGTSRQDVVVSAGSMRDAAGNDNRSVELFIDVRNDVGRCTAMRSSVTGATHQHRLEVAAFRY